MWEYISNFLYPKPNIYDLPLIKSEEEVVPHYFTEEEKIPNEEPTLQLSHNVRTFIFELIINDKYPGSIFV